MTFFCLFACPVETIGDCYVAVTGVPDPQGQHAVIMCKFARDCMSKMSNLLQNKLRFELGEEVQDLKFRVGIHSGPITGTFCFCTMVGQRCYFALDHDSRFELSFLLSLPFRRSIARTTVSIPALW